jgi:hypothetical protein
MGNTMKPVARTSRRQLAATSLILFLSAAFAAKSDATCGDYLMMVGNHGQSHATSSLEPLDLITSPLPRSSGCKNGQCRSAPPLAPLPEPTQTVDWSKQWLTLRAAFSDADRSDARDWGFPSDGIRFFGPFLGIDTPPPRHSA